MAQSYLVLVSDAARLCGVEAFSRLLVHHFGTRATTHVLDADLPELARALRSHDALIFNFPIVGWKPRLFAPSLAALLARLMGRDVVVVLHEWSALDWKRRVVVALVVLLATRLTFSAPEIADEFAVSPLSRLSTRARQVVPIPPNIMPSTDAPDTKSGEVHEGKTKLILGQFGSIYPKKQSAIVLQVVAELLRRGYDVEVIFVGSFIKAMDNVEEDFYASARDLGVGERVTVTGYVEHDSEISALFQGIDVFCYVFPEGLTARRGSVLAAALSGKPVVVNAPAQANALAHHLLFQRLIAAHAIQLVATEADVNEAADAVLAASQTLPDRIDAELEIARLWQDVCARIDNETEKIRTAT